MQRTKRPDVQAQHREAGLQEDTGFYVEFPCGNNPYIYLVFDGKNAKTIRKIHLKSSKLMEEKLIRYYHKGTRYLKMHGAGALLQKVVTAGKPEKIAVSVFTSDQCCGTIVQDS